jgi:hypothetical protein
LDGDEAWLRIRFRQHPGNAAVVRAEKGIKASLRTVQRALEPYRQELLAEAGATVRFETAPGQQLQIDFGERLSRSAAARSRCSCSWPLWGTRRTHSPAFKAKVVEEGKKDWA